MNLQWIAEYHIWILFSIMMAGFIGIFISVVRHNSFRKYGSKQITELSIQTKELGNSQTEILGRLSSLSEISTASQAELAKTLNSRLDTISQQVNTTLHDSSTRTSESLGQLKKHLSKIDEAQQHITTLSNEIVGLQEILSNKQARGAFGEIQLNDIVRNILPPSTFELQAKLSNGTKPDCLIKLPQPPGPIAIDAKFPLESYQKYQDSKDETGKLQAKRQFRLDVRRHLRNISEKYIVPGETAESALMFLPSEAVYAEIHASLTDVVEESHRLRVWIVSPTTLWAMLNTIRAVLKDVHIREQADVIQKEVLLLLDDLARLDDRAEKLQRHFDQASEDLRGLRISTEKILRRGTRIDNLQLEDSSMSVVNEPMAVDRSKKQPPNTLPSSKAR